MTTGHETATGSGLEIRSLRKAFGAVVANDDISLDVEPGEIYGLLGPNGAGKTTLVKQIIGLLKPSSGGIRLDGHDLVADPSRARRCCAFLPQGQLPIDSLRMGEAIELVGRIRGGDRSSVRRRTQELIEVLELEEWRGTIGMKMSGGVRRLVGFAMAAVWPARIVILDEPTNDVDPLRRRLLWQQVRDLGRQGVAVLLVTHNVLEAEHSVDRLAVIDRGRILAQGTPSSLKAADRGHLRLQLRLVPGCPEPELPDFTIRRVRLRSRLHMVVDEGRAGEAIEWARARMVEGVAEEYGLGATTLEDVYLRLIGREDALDRGDAEPAP
ncbi:MAG: ABC transporter ATP-binding protein [Thermoanaerobaculia bacterium]|nr:ABC transporter ATP-binding protein [Thermoanaerobaculia bacterium]